MECAEADPLASSELNIELRSNTFFFEDFRCWAQYGVDLVCSVRVTIDAL